MFWGLILKSNKKYTQTLEKAFHLSQASLDHSSSDNEPVQVMYTHDDNSYLLCTLQKGKIYQCPLDLNFKDGDKLCFSTKGNGIVHLTGFLMDDEDFFDEDMMGDEEESEEEETAIEDLRKKLEAKAKQKPAKEAPASKKKQKPEPEVESSADEEEDDGDNSDDDDDDDEGLNETAEVESGEEEEGDTDDDSDSNDDSDEEATPAPPKQAKLDPQAQQNGKKQKNQKNGLENGEKKPQQQQKDKSGGEGKVQKLQGGLMVQDLKVGSGAEAKPGKKIQVYYEGRLKTNNKVFDATKNGPGFKMTLGRGEVIKGWDIGLSGMKVGGKRRLICPPQLAYGAKGNPPVIPQNATLVFDVELKNVL